MLMMFLYEARARAPRTGTSAAQLGPHFGLILGAEEVKNPRKTSKDDFRHGSLWRLTML